MKTSRAIPLDKKLLNDVARELQEVIAKKTRFREGPLGQKVLEASLPFGLKTVNGEMRTVFVRLQSIPTKSPYYAVSGGYGKGSSGQPYIVININGSLPAETLHRSAASKSCLIADQIYKVLLHEASHAADIFSEGIGKSLTEEQAQNDPKAYYNNPSEVRAYTQEIILESEHAFKVIPKYYQIWGVGKGIEVLLKNSKTWEEIEPYLTDKNKRIVIKSLVQAIDDYRDAQKLASRYRGLK
jgi:hypothetical protein